MIQFKKHEKIDFDKWDQCIEQAINGLIYPYSFYLNQVSPSWNALVYGDYEAVMPLPGKTKYGIQYILQPVFVQQLGVFSSFPVDENLLNAFISAIPEQYWYVILNLNTFNPTSQNVKGASQLRKTYELDLIAPYQEIQKGYSGQTRRNIKKARKEKVFVTPNADPMPVIEAFKNNKGKRIASFPPTQYETLKHLIYSGIHRGDTRVYSAYSAQNSFCAGIVFFTSHKKTILIFSGSTPEARKNGAMSAIIDSYIREHAGKNITLDFEGSMDKNLARFYAGFGSKECVFLQIEINQFPLLLKPFAKWYFKAKQQQTLTDKTT